MAARQPDLLNHSDGEYKTYTMIN